MGWLSPDDQWPAHPGKDARKALAQARSLGWSFREEAHFGRIRCPYDEHDGGCELGIWSTSKDKSGSVTANKIQQKLRACEKLGGPDPAAAVEAVSIAVDKIEDLVVAAEHLRNSDSIRSEAEEILERPATEDDEDQAIELALELEGQATNAENEAAIAASRADAADPWPPIERANGLAEAASERLDEFASEFGEDDKDPEVSVRIADLRSRLATFNT